MKRAWIVALVVGLAFVGRISARTITTGSFVCNPGAIVSVPLTVDELGDVGAASFTVNYDATVVSCLGVDVGEAVSESNFITADTGAGQVVMLATAFRQRSGTVARLRMLARPGTAGLFSDLTIAEAELGAKDGVTDLAVANPVKTVNGMIRMVAESADVRRLEEPFVIWPESSLGSVRFAVGDGLMASDGRQGVSVSGAVTVEGPIPVWAPLNGWQSGSYELIVSSASDLAFEVKGVTNCTVRAESRGGLTAYIAEVVVEGSLAIETDGTELPAATVAQIRTRVGELLVTHPEVTTLRVVGGAAIIPIAVDLGIAPKLDIFETTATATYATPSLAIMAFDPQTGLVRIKVTPGDGNVIRAPLATGCIHVYGTRNLKNKMTYIGGTSFDLTPYLKSETMGEANLTISMGTHTFIKVKAETLIKQEGEQE